MKRGFAPIAIVGCIGCAVIFAFLGIGLMAGLGYMVALDGGGSESSLPEGTFGASGGDLANADALTQAQILDLLENQISYGYNLKDFSQQIYDSSQKFNLNPLFLLAIANKDSSLGTAGAGETCRNPGNLEMRDHGFSESGISAISNCESAYGGSSRWAAFKTYGDGMQAKAWLLRASYLDEGLTTLPQIINKYCPPSECDVSQYVSDVESFMNKYGQIYEGSAS